MKRYRRKPVEVDAVQFKDTDDSYKELLELVGNSRIYKKGNNIFFRRDLSDNNKDIKLMNGHWVMVTRRQINFGIFKDLFEIHGDETFKEKFEEVES